MSSLEESLVGLGVLFGACSDESKYVYVVSDGDGFSNMIHNCSFSENDHSLARAIVAINPKRVISFLSIDTSRCTLHSMCKTMVLLKMEVIGIARGTLRSSIEGSQKDVIQSKLRN